MKITIEKNFRNLKSNTIYEIQDNLGVNVIVGDNGCGKSTLFQALRGYKNNLKSKSIYESFDFKSLSENITVEHDYENIYFYDSVKDNGSDINVSYDAVQFIESGGWTANKLSHGEAGMHYLSLFLTKIKIEGKCLLVLDEADKGFSLTNMVKYYNILLNIRNKFGCDIIAISHNPFLIEQSLVVFDFEKNSYVISKKYLKEKINWKLEKC